MRLWLKKNSGFVFFLIQMCLTSWSSVGGGCDRQPSDWLIDVMMQVWVILYSELGDSGFWPFVSLVTTMMSSPLHTIIVIAVIRLSCLSDPLRFVGITEPWARKQFSASVWVNDGFYHSPFTVVFSFSLPVLIQLRDLSVFIVAPTHVVEYSFVLLFLRSLLKSSVH